MEFISFIKSKAKTLISIFIIFLIVGSVYTFAQTFKYGAKSKVLVIQEGGGGVDPFAVSRSVEYLSTLFSQVVYSNSFFNLVMESDFNIEKSYFDGDSTKQMKKWQKTVSARSLENTGFIVIDVYHPSSYQAKQLALAINHVLMTQNTNYQGIGSSVKINVIDQPIVSNYPTSPNLLINFGLIMVFSLVFGLAYIYLFPENKYEIDISKMFSGKKKPKKTATLKHNFLKPENPLPPTLPVETEERVEENGYQPENRGNINNVLR